MTFKKYNHTNNAFCEVLTPLSDSDTTLLLQGNYRRFPTENFIIKISKIQGTKVIARENIYVARRNNNICTGLIRAYEPVPIDDVAEESIQQAMSFATGDIVEVVISSEFLRDIQNEIVNMWARYIPPHTDLNSITTPGFYYNEKISEVDTMPNIPKRGENAFAMTVRKAANGVIQEWTDYKAREIYIRYNYAGNWGTWNKIYPFSATALDIGGLGGTNTLADNDEMIIKHSGSNKKMTFSDFGKSLVQKLGTNNFSHNYYSHISSNTTSIAVPKGGFFTLNTYGSSGDNYTVNIQYSSNNSSWTTITSIAKQRNASSVFVSGFVKPGFLRLSSTSSFQAELSVQIF